MQTQNARDSSATGGKTPVLGHVYLPPGTHGRGRGHQDARVTSLGHVVHGAARCRTCAPTSKDASRDESRAARVTCMTMLARKFGEAEGEMKEWKGEDLNGLLGPAQTGVCVGG